MFGELTDGMCRPRQKAEAGSGGDVQHAIANRNTQLRFAIGMAENSERKVLNSESRIRRDLPFEPSFCDYGRAFRRESAEVTYLQNSTKGVCGWTTALHVLLRLSRAPDILVRHIEQCRELIFKVLVALI